jgi:hypothetical protein
MADGSSGGTWVMNSTAGQQFLPMKITSSYRSAEAVRTFAASTVLIGRGNGGEGLALALAKLYNSSGTRKFRRKAMRP